MRLLLFLLPILLAAAPHGATHKRTFRTPGSYPVTLTVCNQRGCSKITKIVRVLDPRPSVPRISLPAKLGSAEGSTALTALASGRPPLRWDWTLTRPGRTLRFNTNPALWTFDALGPHQVHVTARNAWGSATSPRASIEIVPSTFQDVPPTSPVFEAVETLSGLGLAAACAPSPRSFCPDRPSSRAQLAAQLVAAAFGPLELLPPATGIFQDVALTHWAATAIEHLYRRLGSACSGSPLRFCPDHDANRAEAAILLVRALRGADYVPPLPTGRFLDVALSSEAAPFIEHLDRSGVDVSCSSVPLRFCPDAPLTRAELATFLVQAFQLKPQPTPLHFAPKHCSPPCTFAVHSPIVFHLDLRGGLPQQYEYDWAGDGHFEEVSTVPVLSHAYKAIGTYTPTLRLRHGARVASLSSAPLRVAAPNFRTAPARPTGIRATFRGIVSPAPNDPPGTLPRASFSIEATAARAEAFQAYLSVNSSPLRLIDSLPASDLLNTPLKIPLFSATDRATLQLRPLNPAGVGPASLNLRLLLY